MPAVAAAVTTIEAPLPEPTVGRSRRTGILAAACVALAASPVVVAALSLVGRPWYPVGDWAGLVFRVSQVGTGDTPLVGFDSVKGWAHPGPLLFWLSAPLYRLTSGDPRAIAWTAGIVNVVVIAALGRVAWRRGGWPLLLGSSVLAALLVHGVEVERFVDLWVPFLPLLAFLLTCFLVWDASLGRRRALVEAAVAASLTAQTHLAFVSLNAVLAAALLGWFMCWPRLLLPTPGPDPDPDPARAALPRPPWSRWYTALRWALLAAAVLWIGPLVDAVFDLHNPWNIARSFGGTIDRVGLANAIGLVGRYVRPDGPWMGGPEPGGIVIQGSGPLPLVGAMLALCACMVMARRRQLVDVAALAWLSLVLVVGAVPAAAQIPMPNEAYLTQWLKVVGGVVWFTVAWTVWRGVEPAVRAVPRRQAAAGVLAGLSLLAASAWTWGEAAAVDLPFPENGEIVQALGDQLEENVPRDGTVRVARRGEYFHMFGAGVIFWLFDNDYDVVTEEGTRGLKWGRDGRWSKGEPYDRLLTVAIFQRSYERCRQDPAVREVASYDGLQSEERVWLEDFLFRLWNDDESLTAAELRRGERLGKRNIQMGVFEGRHICGQDPPRSDWDGSSSATPLLAGLALGGVAGAGGRALIRRRRRRRPTAASDSP